MCFIDSDQLSKIYGCIRRRRTDFSKQGHEEADQGRSPPGCHNGLLGSPEFRVLDANTTVRFEFGTAVNCGTERASSTGLDSHNSPTARLGGQRAQRCNLCRDFFLRRGIELSRGAQCGAQDIDLGQSRHQ